MIGLDIGDPTILADCDKGGSRMLDTLDAADDALGLISRVAIATVVDDANFLH
jgi:hypothetical protein